MTVLETPRLRLRRMHLDDAAFVLDLVNQPSWLDNIGDKGVRSLDDARDYLRTGPLALYERHGFGMYAVERREDGAVIGMCGLIKRDALEDVDLGYALLPAYWGQGFAREAAEAAVRHGFRDFGLASIVAIVSPHNDASVRVLQDVGFCLEREVVLPGSTSPVKLFRRPPP